MTEPNNRREVILMGLATTAGAIAPRVALSAGDDLPLRDPGPRRSVLVVGSNARVLQLQNNRTVATGNYLNETVVPMQALRAAGYGLIVATPDGTKPALQKLIAGERLRAATMAHDWPYRDYRMTIFSNSEEKPVENNVFGARLQYSVADALSLAGGRVEHGAVDYTPFVVTDRELITGQNPRSDHQLAARFVEALNAQSTVVPSSHLNGLSI